MADFVLRVGVTGRALRKFRTALRSYDRHTRPTNVHPLLWKASTDALRSTIDGLEKEFGELVEICLWGF